MVPDRGFRKQLHAMDEELDVVWDWGWKKWEIWRFPKDGSDPFCCMVVQTQGRTYKELSADVLIRLQQTDPARYTLAQMVAYFEEMDQQVARRRAKKFAETIRAITLDTFNYARGVLQVHVPREMKLASLVRVGD